MVLSNKQHNWWIWSSTLSQFPQGVGISVELVFTRNMQSFLKFLVLDVICFGSLDIDFEITIEELVRCVVSRVLMTNFFNVTYCANHESAWANSRQDIKTEARTASERNQWSSDCQEDHPWMKTMMWHWDLTHSIPNSTLRQPMKSWWRVIRNLHPWKPIFVWVRLIVTNKQQQWSKK